MAVDDRRVEPRHLLVGSGAGTTPERIAELERRAREVERLRRPKPTRAFSEVLSAAASAVPDSEPSDKQKRHEALPKTGPRPSLLHPAQRDLYGRSDTGDDTVVLKA